MRHKINNCCDFGNNTSVVRCLLPIKGCDILNPNFVNIALIGIAALAAIVIIVLLCKKIIKSILALILMAAVITGCWFGINTLDNRTNIQKKLPSFNTAAEQLQSGSVYSDVKSMHCNYLGSEIGVSVFFNVRSQSNEAMTERLLSDTRKLILNTDFFFDICSINCENEKEIKAPLRFCVGIKYKGLDIRYYEAKIKPEYEASRTLDGNSPAPDEMYGEFNVIINTGK